MNKKKGLAFSHLNLRFNPFGEIPRDIRSQLAIVELGDLPHLLASDGYAIQFIADHGLGKSTHLIALHSHFSESPYTQLYPGDKPVFQKSRLHFVDSIETISEASRKKLYRKAKSIAVTTHQDFTRELQRAGYNVITRKVSTDDERVLEKIFRMRIEYARRDNGPVPTISKKTLHALRDRFGDDIRSMIDWLYDEFQALKEIRDV